MTPWEPAEYVPASNVREAYARGLSHGMAILSGLILALILVAV